MRILLAVLVAATASTALPTPAEAACGWYAFAGAYKSRRAAQRQARRLNGIVFDVDASDSPNAGQGWYAVGFGPTDWAQADTIKRNYRADGVRGAYAARRCFYGN